MQIELGEIVEGKITSITNFGAFVELPNKQTGLIHISEVSNKFVNEVRDFLEEGQTVKVKVIDLGKNGKLGLSIKQLEPQTSQKPKPDFRSQRKPRFNNKPKEVKEVKTPEQIEHDRFEDMMSKYKKISDENMSTLKRNERVKQRRSGNIK